MSFIGKIWRSFFRAWVAVVALIILAGVVAFKIVRASSTRRAPVVAAQNSAAPSPDKPDAPAQTVTKNFGTQVTRFLLPPDQPAKKEEGPKGPPPIPDHIRRQLITAPANISLYAPITPPAPPKYLPPTFYLPSFRLIHCMLITSPETNGMETPLIGIVLENVVNIDPDGISRIVIPAGVELHGLARPDAVRDRIDGSGNWTFVWRTNDANNATEYSVPALVLNRDFDPVTNAYGPTEKSPGLKGRRIESVSDAQIKEILLDSLSAVSKTMKDLNQSTNLFSGQVSYSDKPSLKNAALNAFSAGSDRFAAQLEEIRKQIDTKGYYVAVLAGKEFYLYTRAPIDLRKARHPEVINAAALAATAAPSGPASLLDPLHLATPPANAP